MLLTSEVCGVSCYKLYFTNHARRGEGGPPVPAKIARRLPQEIEVRKHARALCTARKDAVPPCTIF